MDFVFGFAGIPEEILDDVWKVRQSIVGQNTACFTVTHGRYGEPYQYKHLTRATDKFVRHLKLEVQDVDPSASLALFYVKHDGMNVEVLEAQLFPHVFMVPIEWSIVGSDKHTLSQAKNQLVLKLRLACTEVRKALQALKREFSEAAQRTSLLLPYRNFESRYLRDHLKTVQSSLLDSEDKHDVIQRNKNNFLHNHPLQKTQEGHRSDRRYFVDERGIQFKPPGRHLHGIHHANAQHNDICFISANRRLGAVYAPALHYDCQKGEPFSAYFFNCHTTTRALMHVPRHINVAPNDNCRLSK